MKTTKIHADGVEECYKALACAVVLQAYRDARIANNKSKQDYFLNWFNTEARGLVSNDTADAIISKLKRCYNGKSKHIFTGLER